MSKQIRKKEVVLSSTEAKGDRSSERWKIVSQVMYTKTIVTLSLRLETSTTDPGADPPEAPELELASATIAARRFARAD